MEFILLTTPAILITFLIAVITSISARFISNKYIHNGLYIISFLCVAGCTVYALLLGVDLKELLAYILIFTLLGLTSFFSISNEKDTNSNINDEKKDVMINPDANDEEQAEEKTDEL